MRSNQVSGARDGFWEEETEAASSRLLRSWAGEGIFSGCGVGLREETWAWKHTWEALREEGFRHVGEMERPGLPCGTRTELRRDAAGDDRGQTAVYPNSKDQPLQVSKQKNDGILSLILFPEPTLVLKTSWVAQ